MRLSSRIQSRMNASEMGALHDILWGTDLATLSHLLLLLLLPQVASAVQDVRVRMCLDHGTWTRILRAKANLQWSLISRIRTIADLFRPCLFSVVTNCPDLSYGDSRRSYLCVAFSTIEITASYLSPLPMLGRRFERLRTWTSLTEVRTH